MGDDGMLAPYDGLVSHSRNATVRSLLAEGLVDAFLRNGATAASVRWKLTGYTLEEMYKSLWCICRKEPYRQLVTVSKRSGRLLLRRVG